mmetsp:Transcript_35644/g.107235  ORF Transcript_35644/g.107235 Transcript_35644/m.107235 type:complete len:353 (-) Transcript_35644:293-1351(-)
MDDGPLPGDRTVLTAKRRQRDLVAARERVLGVGRRRDGVCGCARRHGKRHRSGHRLDHVRLRVHGLGRRFARRERVSPRPRRGPPRPDRGVWRPGLVLRGRALVRRLGPPEPRAAGRRRRVRHRVIRRHGRRHAQLLHVARRQPLRELVARRVRRTGGAVVVREHGALRQRGGPKERRQPPRAALLRDDGGPRGVPPLRRVRARNDAGAPRPRRERVRAALLECDGVVSRGAARLRAVERLFERDRRGERDGSVAVRAGPRRRRVDGLRQRRRLGRRLWRRALRHVAPAGRRGRAYNLRRRAGRLGDVDRRRRHVVPDGVFSRRRRERNAASGPRGPREGPRLPRRRPRHEL